MDPRVAMCIKISLVRALLPLSHPSRSYLIPILALQALLGICNATRLLAVCLKQLRTNGFSEPNMAEHNQKQHPTVLVLLCC